MYSCLSSKPGNIRLGAQQYMALVPDFSVAVGKVLSHSAAVSRTGEVCVHP